MRFSLPPIGGLSGKEYDALELTVENRTASQVVIDDAVLESNGRSYPFKRDFLDEQRRTVAPGVTEAVPLWFEFAQPLSKVYGDTVTVQVSFASAQGRMCCALTSPVTRSGRHGR